MSRRPTTVFVASITLCCRDPKCGHEFSVSASSLENKRSPTCPRCSYVQHLTDQQILHLRSNNVAKISAAHRDVFGKGGEEPN